jgi:cytochrome c-type biogenesis protein CcmF
VTLGSVRDVTEPQRDLVVADLSVSGNGGTGNLRPALVFYPNSTQAVGSPGVSAGARDDVYTILAAYDARDHSWATIRVLVIPLVSWLWLGGAIVGLGAIIAALPPAVGPRRVAVPRPAAAAASPSRGVES